MSDRQRLLNAVEKIGIKLCSYSYLDKWAIPCDCKYGVESDRLKGEGIYCGEQTGCPEMRDIYSLVELMTDEEYEEISKRWILRVAKQQQSALQDDGADELRAETRKEYFERRWEQAFSSLADENYEEQNALAPREG